MGTIMEAALAGTIFIIVAVVEFIAIHLLNREMGENRAPMTIIAVMIISKPALFVLFVLSMFIPFPRYLLFPSVLGFIYGVSKSIYRIQGDRQVSELETRIPIAAIAVGDLATIYVASSLLL